MSSKTLYLTILHPENEDNKIKNINKILLGTKSVKEISRFAKDLKVIKPDSISEFKEELVNTINDTDDFAMNNNAEGKYCMNKEYMSWLIENGESSVVVLYTKQDEKNQYECVFTYVSQDLYSIYIEAFTINNSIPQKQRSLSGKGVFAWFYKKVKNTDWVLDIFIESVGASEPFWKSVKFNLYKSNSNEALIPMKRHIDDWSSIESQKIQIPIKTPSPIRISLRKSASPIQKTSSKSSIQKSSNKKSSNKKLSIKKSSNKKSPIKKSSNKKSSNKKLPRKSITKTTKSMTKSNTISTSKSV